MAARSYFKLGFLAISIAIFVTVMVMASLGKDGGPSLWAEIERGALPMDRESGGGGPPFCWRRRTEGGGARA